MKSFFRKPGMLTGAFVVSLGLNLFFAGFFAARLIRQSPEPEALPVIALTRMTDFLPPQRQIEIRELMRDNRVRIAESIAKMRSANARAAALLAAESYDRGELEEALNEVRILNSQTQEAVHEFVIRVVPQIGPENRRKMIQSWHLRRHRRDEPPPTP